ncbi:MAG: TonB-dependent siderophore receptor [Proteobacteria bacterium]|nr:MAG: TonB-dependent siderophore receptor [Pseudomonadota bacterium]
MNVNKSKSNVFLPASLACFVGVNFLAHTAYAQAANPADTQTLPEVKVTAEPEPGSDGYQSKEMSSPKIPTKKLDTPQSVTIIPEKLMRDQGVTTLRDALRDVSGLSIAAGEGGAQGDNLSLRGFSARSDIYQDGMRDFGSYNRDSFTLENVEVLKGPSSALFGRGSTGGVINQVTKTPKAKGFSDGLLAIGSDNTRRATADLNKPLTDGIGFRLNLMDHYQNVAGRDVTENKRFGIAPSLTFGLGGPTRLTVSYLHQNENNIPDYGIPYVNSRPAPVSYSNFYGFENNNYLKTNVDVLTVRAEHDFGNGLVIRDQIRHGYYERAYQITEARVPATVTPATPIDTIRVTRGQIIGDSKEESFDNDLSLSAKFSTGFAQHNAIIGLEAISDSSRPKRLTVTGAPDASLINPDINQQFSGTIAQTGSTVTTAKTLATYLADSVNLGEQWIVSAGVRWETIKAESRANTGATETNFSHTDKALSWRGGLTFKPVASTSVYFNYGTSFQPSIEGLSLAANTADLKPEESETYEVGAKSDLLGGNLTLEGAVFRLEKTNARTPDPSDATLNVLTGGQRVDGAEISLVGRPSPLFQISSGYTHLIGKVTESNRAGEKDQTLTNTPKHSGNLWVTYLASDRWDFGVGVFALTERFGATTTDVATGLKRKVAGYTTTNAMAKYRVTPDMDVQLNLSNIGDVEYFDSLHPGHLIPGAGRTALLSTQFRL